MTRLLKQRQRVKRYFDARRRIFNDCVSTLIDTSHCNEIVGLSPDNDPRPHVSLTIANKTFSALLDSGATVSIFGKGSIEFLDKNGLKWKKMRSFVRTADGTSNEVMGYLSLPITFNGQTSEMNFIVAPSLTDELYLGIDFWNRFHIVPFIVNELKVDPTGKETNSHNLTEGQGIEVKEVIASFPSFETRGLGRTSMIEHKIDIGESPPIKQRHYAISPAKRQELYEEIDRMLELDIIEECEMSAWSSPVVCVKKSNGKVRMCIDSRKLNKVTKKDAYPLPLIDGLLGRLSETRFISSLDLKDAFWQIPLAAESRDKTAFVVPGRPLYQFKVMPFGLCNAPQTMSRLMDKVIPHRLHDKIFVYLDDLLIISASYEEHIYLLRFVSKMLSDAGLTINVEKSHFLLREIKYLGFLVGEKGLRVDPGKVEAIVNFPAPRTTKQTRRFLGMASWYRRFIEMFSDITAPITDLLKKGKKFVWTSEANDAFEKLKILLSTAPVLITPDYTRRFYIRCDASTQGLGGVLFQKSDSGDEMPISFMSVKLNQAQKNYTTTELECLAAVISVKKFRPYVEGHDFTLITDHASLKWLMSLKDLSGRLARWSLLLQSFNFEIEHQKGALNVVPDALSRIYCDSLEEFEESLSDMNVVSTIRFESLNFENDPDYVEFRTKIELNASQYPIFRIRDGRVFIRREPRMNENLSDSTVWKLWIPKSMSEFVIKQLHDNPLYSHGGIKKTLYRLQQFYFWPRMLFDVKNFVMKCEICKTTKAPNQILRPPMGTPFLSERPFQRIYIDLLGPYPRSKSGKTMIIIVVDQLTKFLILKTIAKATASKIVSCLREDVFMVFGVPEIVHSDNGGQFISKEFKVLLNEFGVKHMRTPVYSPQSNASERVNRSILAAIRAYVDMKHREWDKYLPEIGCALRSAFHESIGFSPHYSLFGYKKIDHGDAYDLLRAIDCVGEGELETLSTTDSLKIVHDNIRINLRKSSDKNKQTYDLRSRTVSFDPGQKVFVRQHPLSDASKNFSAKLAPKFSPAYILCKSGTASYIVSDEKGKVLGTYHGKDIKS